VTLVQIAILAVLAAVLGRLKAGRQHAMLATSAAVLFWLQPTEPIASLSFWFPAGTLVLVVVCWIITADSEARAWRANWPALAVLAGVGMIIGLSPSVALWLNPALMVPSASRLLPVAISVLAFAVLGWRWRSSGRGAVIVASMSILLVFVFIKSPSLQSAGLSLLNRLQLGKNAAEDIPLVWLGYSYVAFRLLHTLRDRQVGRLPPVGLGEYVNYVIFFPSFVAGPIDRVQRFVSELRAPLSLTNEDWVETATRLIVGLFKKLVLADLLAVIAFNDLLVQYVRSPGWMWIFLYAYAFRIYLDFSAYTDIAIAIGRLLGVRLPENFAAPYLKPNIALFWNSWHMSLTQWFRAYVFNPLTRRLRTAPARLPDWLAVFVTQLVTMLLIGFWHGITWSFALWGLWHGLGLFIHNRWSEFVRARWPGLAISPIMGRVFTVVGVFITFNFVSLGWLFFGLSTPELAFRAFQLLFGSA
jgi:alginate O-acetyltransferase complex protein AlgI